MPIKSNMTKPDKKKRVRINRTNPPEVVHETSEEVVHEVVPEVIPEVVPEVVQEEEEKPVDVVFEEHLGVLSEEPVSNQRMLIEPEDEENCPISPCVSPKKSRVKLFKQKPLRNEKGEYLNPITNRYLKEGTTAFNKLVKLGVITLEEETICV